MNLSPLFYGSVAVLVSLSLSFGCGDQKKQVASASARPICKDSPESEYEPRCREGERDCCALLVYEKDERDPKNVDAFALACAGGHVPACTVARNADRSSAWKLDVLAKGCAAGNSDTNCRAATFLGFALEPDKVADRAATYCAKMRADLQITATRVVKCAAPDAAVLDAIKADAVACADGAFEHCKALTGVDGNSAGLVTPIAVDVWKKRGLDATEIAEVENARIAPMSSPGTPPKGTVVVAVGKSAKTDAKSLDAKTVGDAIRRREDALKSCIGVMAQDKSDKGGKVDFEIIVDARGVVAATPDATADLKGSVGLDACVRSVIQDSRIDGVTAPGRAHVTLTLSP